MRFFAISLREIAAQNDISTAGPGLLGRACRGLAGNPTFAGNVIARASAPGKSSSKNLPAFSEILRYLAARDGRSE
jgi:hypothetical protein